MLSAPGVMACLPGACWQPEDCAAGSAAVTAASKPSIHSQKHGESAPAPPDQHSDGPRHAPSQTAASAEPTELAPAPTSAPATAAMADAGTTRATPTGQPRAPSGHHTRHSIPATVPEGAAPPAIGSLVTAGVEAEAALARPAVPAPSAAASRGATGVGSAPEPQLTLQVRRPWTRMQWWVLAGSIACTETACPQTDRQSATDP